MYIVKTDYEILEWYFQAEPFSGRVEPFQSNTFNTYQAHPHDSDKALFGIEVPIIAQSLTHSLKGIIRVKFYLEGLPANDKQTIITELNKQRDWLSASTCTIINQAIQQFAKNTSIQSFDTYFMIDNIKI